MTVNCQVFYQGRISPDFYGWVFPHGATTASAWARRSRVHDLKESNTAAARRRAVCWNARRCARRGPPWPLKPLKRWDDGRNVLLAGDAAGVVAPASGERHLITR